MSRRTQAMVIGCMYLAVYLTSPLVANPLGSGALAGGIDVSPSRTILAQRNASGSISEVLKDDSQIVGGASAIFYVAPSWGIGVSLSDNSYARTDTFTISGYEYADKATGDVIGYGGRCILFPAALLGIPYKLGVNANPDGWISWPSVTIAFRGLHWEEAIAHTTNNPYVLIPATDYDDGTRFDGSAEIDYPVKSNLSLHAGYLRNLSIKTTTNGISQDFSNSYWESYLGATMYLDLIDGASTDVERAFLPGIGRRGQLAISVGWNYRANNSGQALIQNRSIVIGFPVTDSLGVMANLGQQENPPPTTSGIVTERNDNSYDAGARVVWAWGDPGKRENHSR